MSAEDKDWHEGAPCEASGLFVRMEAGPRGVKKWEGKDKRLQQ